MQSMVLSRESISSVYAIVIPVRPLFATSSFTQSTGIHSDSVIGTALRRACGASCIRLSIIGIHVRVLWTFPIWTFRYLVTVQSLYSVSWEFSEFLSSFLVRIVYRYLFWFLVFLLFDSPNCAACTITGIWSESILFACSLSSSCECQTIWLFYSCANIILYSLVLTVADSLVYALSVFLCIFLNTSPSCFLLIIIVTNPPLVVWYVPSSIYRMLCFPHS